MNRPKYTSVRGVAVLANIFAAPNLFCLKINLVDTGDKYSAWTLELLPSPSHLQDYGKTGSSGSVPFGYIKPPVYKTDRKCR